MPLRLSKHRVLLDGIPLNESQSSSLPSASTLDIWSVSGNVIPISGSATITGFTAAPQSGTRRTLLCTGTPTFTHSTNLLLPGSADYTATAGDRIEVLAVTTTQFRLSVIKASVLPDVQFAKDGSGNVTGILDQTGVSPYGFAALPQDANGVIEGSIALRSGTVADLLAITDAGNGEVAVATDTDALVVYLGSPSVGQIYGRTTVIGEAYLGGAFQTYANNTTVVIPFTMPAIGGYATSLYVQGLFNSVSKWFIAPPAAFASHFTVDLTASFTDGTIRQVDFGLEYDSSAGGDGTAWTSLGPIGNGAALNNTKPGKKHRFTLNQSSGATLYSASITLLVQFRRI